MSAPAGSSSDRIDPATWRIAGTIVLGGIMTNVDTTVVNVALASLAREFGSSVTSVQWVATGYLLALAVVIPLSGWATDRFGGRQVWIASIGMFVAGSMLAGAAWSLSSLIFFRVLQGLGGGMIMPVGMTLLTRAAGRGRVGRVMGALGVQQVLGPVLGPVIGGVLVEHAGWRWVFYVNAPIGALAVVAAARFLPRTRPQPCDRLDARGFVLLSPGLAALVYGLAGISQHGGFSDPRTFVPIVLGIVLVTAFVLRARRVRNALIDVRLFAGRAFSAGVGATFCIGMALFGALFLLPLYYQGARGQSPLDAGLLMAPQGIGAAVMTPFAGWLTDRVGAGRVVLAGLAVVVAGTLPFALAGTSTPYPVLALALVVRGVGLGASTVPAMAGAYASLDEDAVARASSVLNVMKRLGGSVGVALVAVVLEHQLPGSARAVGERALPASIVADAFARSFWWVLGFCALAVIPAAFLPWRPAVAGNQKADGGADREPGSPHRRSFLAPVRRVATIGRVTSPPQDPVPPDPPRARSRRRRRSGRASVPVAWTGPPAAHRLLLLASDPVDGRRLARLLDRDREKSTAVLVVAPALHRTRLRFWVSDSDEAIEHARGVQQEIVDALRREHVPSGGHVGAPDPLVAIEDALRFFDADRIAIALHKRGRRRYRERDLRAEVERRFRRPVIAVEPQPA